ncbi:MAG: tetratricopeptide repeat protein [Planctomycetaceae bacterium]
MSHWLRRILWITLPAALLGVGAWGAQAWLGRGEQAASQAGDANAVAGEPVDADPTATRLGDLSMTATASQAADAEPFPVNESLATANLLQRADEYILEAGYAPALRLLKALLPTSAGELRPQVDLRIALCAEATNEPKLAQSHFDAVLKSSAAPRLLQSQARLGKIRCWSVAGHPELARAALYQELVRADGSSTDGDGERWHLLAHLLADAALSNDSAANPLDDRSLFSVTPQVTPRDVLSALRDGLATQEPVVEPPAAGDPVDASEAFEEGLRILQRFGDDPAEIVLDVHLDSVSLPQALERVAATCGWRLELAAVNRDELGQRQRPIHCRQMNAAVLLDALLAEQSLGWSFAAGVLTLVDIDRLSADDRMHAVRGMARRGMQQALAKAPEHDWSVHTWLALGRLTAAEQQPQQAIRHFQQAIAVDTSERCTVELQLNTARLLLSLGERGAALQSLYRAVDSVNVHPLHPVAYLSIGRIQIEEARPHRAIPELMAGWPWPRVKSLNRSRRCCFLRHICWMAILRERTRC